MEQKLNTLLDRLADCGSLVVALSGGVDSSVLAKAPATGAWVSTTPAASAQLTRVQANEIVNKILPKYQPLIDNRTLHTKGGDFRTVYDLETVQPKPEYLAIYNKVKAELWEMGLPIK